MSRCCRKNDDDADDAELEKMCEEDALNQPFTWHPTIHNVQQIAYVRRLQHDLQNLQGTCFYLRTQLARLQFRVRQIISSECCSRRHMVAALERIVVKDNPMDQCRPEVLPSLVTYNCRMGDIKKKQMSFITDVRNRIGEFPGPEFEFLYNVDWDVEPEKPNPKCVELDVPKSSKSMASVKSAKSSKDVDSRSVGGADTMDSVDTMDKISQTEIEVPNEEDSKEGLTELVNDIEATPLPSDRSIPFKKLRNMYQKKCTVNPVNS